MGKFLSLYKNNAEYSSDVMRQYPNVSLLNEEKELNTKKSQSTPILAKKLAKLYASVQEVFAEKFDTSTTSSSSSTTSTSSTSTSSTSSTTPGPDNFTKTLYIAYETDTYTISPDVVLDTIEFDGTGSSHNYINYDEDGKRLTEIKLTSTYTLVPHLKYPFEIGYTDVNLNCVVLSGNRINIGFDNEETESLWITLKFDESVIPRPELTKIVNIIYQTDTQTYSPNAVLDTIDFSGSELNRYENRDYEAGKYTLVTQTDTYTFVPRLKYPITDVYTESDDLYWSIIYDGKGLSVGFNDEYHSSESLLVIKIDDGKTTTTSSTSSTSSTTTPTPETIKCEECGHEYGPNEADGNGKCPKCHGVGITVCDKCGYEYINTEENRGGCPMCHGNGIDSTTPTTTSSPTTTSTPNSLAICNDCGYKFSGAGLNTNDGCPNCGSYNWSY